MVRIIVDDKNYQAHEGDNLLQACLSHGLNLPYFCWHPAMGSVGSCRQCAVIQYRDENDQRGRLVMACMTPVSDGARISVDSARAQEFRASVIEWLMLNHPHDCPVCEEGGECHLQDMTVMTGHTARRYSGNKRTFRNQYLGPFLNHEMNRCITCYRCVRYYRDYAGGTDLQALGSRDRMYFGRTEDGVLESEFSGNLIEVCPTGVFTDKPFSATYTRKWDLQSAPSVCTGCAIGCNITPGERYGRLKRVQNRYHDQINGYFLCDRGRFGADYINNANRPTHAGFQLPDGSYQAVTKAAAVSRLAKIIESGKVLGIGSPRASIESNFALRTLVGGNNFCAGYSDREALMVELGMRLLRAQPHLPPSLKQVEAADAVLILGEDVTNTAPRLALALRQTARNRSKEMAASAAIPLWQDAGVRSHAQAELTPIFCATHLPSRLDDIARDKRCGAPQKLARLGRAIAARLGAESLQLEAADLAFVTAAADVLKNAKRPLIVSGTSLLEPTILQAAAEVAEALNQHGAAANLLLCFAESNTLGSAMMKAELSLTAVLEKVLDGHADTLVILENDLYRRAAPTLVEAALKAAKATVVLDILETETLAQASVVLPAASFAECAGTCVNYESRAQHYYQVFAARNEAQPSWQWLSQTAAAMGRKNSSWKTRELLLSDCAGTLEQFSDVCNAVFPASYRAVAGVKIPRQSPRYSGRTAKNAAREIHEPKTAIDASSPFSFSMEGDNTMEPGSLVPFVWTPGWNSNQSVIRFQEEVNGPMRGDESPVFLLKPGSFALTALDFDEIPQQEPADGGCRLIPVHSVFGSDELSAQSPAIGERTPAPQIIFSPQDAARLSVNPGDGVRCSDFSPHLSFEVVVDANMTSGYAGFIQGVRGSWTFSPEGSVKFERDPNWVRKVEPDLIARD